MADTEVSALPLAGCPVIFGVEMPFELTKDEFGFAVLLEVEEMLALGV